MSVECYDQEGKAVYEMILRHILQEVQVTRSVKDVKIYVDPREPVFIIVVQMQKASSPVLLEDFAEYKYDKNANEAFIRIKDEKYLPDLLNKLWEVEGRNRIHQPNRFEVIVDDPQTKLEGMVVKDPQEDLRKKVYDAIFRIIPEGFRVIDHYSEDDILALTCTDEMMQDRWLEKTKEMVKQIKNSE
ncbi:MAG TPA: methanogenesis marker 17 protein [Methanobacteriaceae archaeon]|nr:methanogenesis marker 17 protein [Methanobacteriaceae archaeon]